MAMVTVATFLQRHPVPGLEVDGSGSSTGSLEVLETVPSPGVNIQSADVVFDVLVTAADHSQLEATAEVRWSETRPTEERVPAQDHAVVISRHDGSASSIPTTTPGPLIIVDPATVDHLAALLNSFTTHTPPPDRCGPPDNGVTYEVSFSTAAGAPANVTATVGYCKSIAVRLEGQPPQPALSDRHGALGTEITSLLKDPHPFGSP